VVAYDLINEPPSDPVDQNRILRLYDRLIAEVRRVAPDKMVMFEPANGDSSMEGADLALLRDRRNLVFSLHDYYAGGAGDGYARGGAQLLPEDGARYAWDGRTGYDDPDESELARHLRVNVDIMRAAGIPVWIGEFGINPRAPNARRWIRDKVALFERYELGYAWWLYDAKGPTAPLEPGAQRFRDFVRLLSPRR
jgi:hypothetical protein